MSHVEKKKVVLQFSLSALLVFGMSTNSFASGDNPTDNVESLSDIISKGSVSGKFRSLFFSRDFDPDSINDWETFGLGGQLKLETASVAGFSGGIGFKTGQGAGINSDNQGVYIGMLPTDSDGNAENYAALDEYFLRYNGFDTTVTIGAQPLATPDMNGHYIRLTEKKYRGLGISNKSIENIEFQGYYITDFISWTEEEFQSITSGFTGDDTDAEGAFIGGLIWNPGSLKLQVWDYYFADVMNRYVAQGNFSHTIYDDVKMSYGLQYLGIQDVEDSLAGIIDTYCLVGSVGITGYKGLSLTGLFGTNGDDSFTTPFGGNRPILMQVTTVTGAEQDTLGFKLGYDFSAIGLNGLSAYVFYANIDSPDDGDNASPDTEEVDFSLFYNFSGWAEKMSLWLRYAIIDKDEAVQGGVDANDFRVYLNFSF